MSYKNISFAGLATAMFLGMVWAQSQPAAKAPSPSPNEELTALVQKQFGKTFTLPAGFPTPLITADFDGDGVEDVAIVAFSKEPIPDSFEYKYRVVDPFNGFFGMGDPSITTAFSTSDPKHKHQLLVIFGAGAEGWHAPVPKAKFVMVNLPFDTIEVGRMLIKKNKPPIFVIKARETQVLDSAVFWEEKRKRWRWQPGGTPE
ncbi:MAG TPA: hypothetical protein VNW97_07995 [Candidatus Saccharimonadales bacterium]|jgi:hypothetical protein|nr:hypothetical protein [Candidatus Saccharimonadales bacterium]